MADRRENSLLVSLKELRDLEEDRVREEEDAVRAREEAERRAKEDAIRAAKEAEEAKIREAEDKIRRETEEKERKAREERLRIEEAERRARIEAEAKLEEARIAADARIKAAKKPPVRLIVGIAITVLVISLAILASGDRRALLHRIVAPTLVVHGSDDPLVPVAGGRDTALHIPGSRLEIIEGCGHFPHVEDPVRFVEILTDFLATTEPADVHPEHYLHLLAEHNRDVGDPALPAAGWAATEPAADDVLRRGGGAAHVFNLGHGVLPETDPEVLERLVAHVHASGTTTSAPQNRTEPTR